MRKLHGVKGRLCWHPVLSWILYVSTQHHQSQGQCRDPVCTEQTRPLGTKPVPQSPRKFSKLTNPMLFSRAALSCPKRPCFPFQPSSSDNIEYPYMARETGKFDHAMLSTRHLCKLGPQTDHFVTQETEYKYHGSRLANPFADLPRAFFLFVYTTGQI